MTQTSTGPRHLPAWKRFLKTPKGYILSALVPLSLFAGGFRQGPVGLLHVLVAVATALGVDAGVAMLLRRRLGFSTGGAITGLIVGDVLSGLTPLYLVSVTVAVALASKHLLKRGRKPIFNPAAAGLLIAILGFGSAQSWWAGLSLLPPWGVPVLILAGLFVAIRVKKYPQVLAFLGTYFLLVLIMALFHLGLASNTPAAALRVPFVNSALFLAFFMLTDPPTSPASMRGQIQFGVLVAFSSVVLFAAVGGLSYMLIGLLTGNAWSAGAAWWSRASRGPVANKGMRTGFLGVGASPGQEQPQVGSS